MPPPLPALSSLPSLHHRTEPGLGVIGGPTATGKSALADRLLGTISPSPQLSQPITKEG
ncbi:MAG: hypothetical protein ACKO21_10295 [Nodosilinea sp.]